MTKSLITFSLLSISLLTACDSAEGPKDLSSFMVDISEFTINNELLKDGDDVQILGSSGNLTRDHNIDFYNLVVVKSLETGDTINVLVTNFFQSDLNDPNTQFISNSSVIGKLIENATDGGKELEDTNVSEMQAKAYDKVFYDSEYIQLDVRKFPAVTGNLGKYTIEGNSENIESSLSDAFEQ